VSSNTQKKRLAAGLTQEPLEAKARVSHEYVNYVERVSTSQRCLYSFVFARR